MHSRFSQPTPISGSSAAPDPPAWSSSRGGRSCSQPHAGGIIPDAASGGREGSAFDEASTQW
jgi:hypothetical protein